MIKKNNNKIKKLSVIVPAYKAEKFIDDSLLGIKNVLDQTRYDYEIVCVVDGMIDNTFKEAKKIARKYPENIKIVGYQNNLGKGHAVRFGMAKASGDIIAFIDAGKDLNPSSLFMVLEHFNWYKADIIVGSKRHPASLVTYPPIRKILSFGYQVLVRLLFNLNIRDTQVGVKVFRRKVLEDVMPRLLVKTFAFDIEILSVANYLGYKRIYEAPIDLKMDFSDNSTIVTKGFIRIAAGMAWDTLAVFYRLQIKGYYNSKNRKNWITPDYLVIKSTT